MEAEHEPNSDLQFCDFVLAEPELFQARQGV